MTGRSSRRRRWFVIAAVTISVFLVPAVGRAHPLGNFTINQHVGIHVGEGALSIDYVLDMAEIPAFAVIREIDTADPESLDDHAARTCATTTGGLNVSIDGQPVDLRIVGAEASMPPGNSGVPTLRVECVFQASVESGRLTVANTNYEDRIGWREMVATSDGVPISTDLPAESLSARLTAYPEDRLSSVPDVRVAEVISGAGQVRGGSQTVPARMVAFDSWLDIDGLGLASAVIAVGAAIALGAGHALAPGHGKTVVAAYLVASRGTWRQAVALALATAVSHTVGVGLLGVMVATASVTFEPALVYPYLSTAAGLVVLVVGARLMVRLVRSNQHQHHHAHTHARPHHEDQSHSHPGLSWRSVAALGLSGGLVPSASAVVLLLGAVHIGHSWFGVLLVTAFGVGMSLALVGSGMLAVLAQRWGWLVLSRRGWRRHSTRWVARLGAGAVMVLGVVMTISGLGEIGPIG